MTYLGKLMLTENGGKHPVAYYAHRVHVIEVMLETEMEDNANLRGKITALRHQVNQLTTQVTNEINKQSG